KPVRSLQLHRGAVADRLDQARNEHLLLLLRTVDEERPDEHRRLEELAVILEEYLRAELGPEIEALRIGGRPIGLAQRRPSCPPVDSTRGDMNEAAHARAARPLQ